MKKYKLLDLVSKGTHARKEIRPEVVIGDTYKGYDEGTILDANAMVDVVGSEIANIVDGAAEALDTLNELGNAIPTKTSQLTNDAGYTTNIGTITSIKMNGSTIASSGEVDLGTVITAHQSLENYVTKTEFNSAVSDSADDWYGIEWTSSNATPHRIGNMNMHRNLPIQSGMKRCMVQDNGTVYGYISSSDPTKYDDGRTADYTGAHGQVMVEIPEYHYEAISYVEDTITHYALKLYPYSSKGKLSKKVYVGAMEGITDDANSNATTKKLYSICLANVTVVNGEINASEVAYETGAENYRGGSTSTTATDDANVKSLLGRPKTNLTRANFRTRAAARGTGWSQQYWNAYMSIVRLYVVEYSNFNSQDTYYSTTDPNGYKRGGLGTGVSTTTGNAWDAFNANNPFIPCGITKSLCNNTGIVIYKFAETEFTSSAISFTVPSYRGIENPFTHIWKWTDGININTTSGSTTVYTCDNISNFADDTSSNYQLRVTFTKPSDGYIKTCNWDSNGDFIPTSTPGSENSYLYDYSWWGDGWKVLRSGGLASHEAKCGLFCFSASAGSASAYASVGGRLYFTPQN